MKKKLPFGAKAAVLATLFIFTATGWAMFLSAQRDAALAVNKNNYIRLHILANSDSLKDQELKLKVRDAVVNYLTPLVKDAADPLAARQIISERREEILKIAREVITRNAAHYPVTMEMGNFEFPLKNYGELTLPAGNYQAVRLLIGEGAGQNWWCVLFPPLCFIDGSITQAAPFTKEDAPPEKSRPEIKIRWKIMELIKD